jgi:hypothetical protein
MSDAAEWIVSADTDLDASRRCLADPPNVDVAAYHCQQAAEKLIKAVLVVRASRIHVVDPGMISGWRLRRFPLATSCGRPPRRSTQSQTGRFSSATRPTIRCRPNRCPSRARWLPGSDASTRFASRSQHWSQHRPPDSHHPVRPGQHRLEQHLAAGLGFLGLDALRLVVRKPVLARGKNHRCRHVPRYIHRVVPGARDDFPG